MFSSFMIIMLMMMFLVSTMIMLIFKIFFVSMSLMISFSLEFFLFSNVLFMISQSLLDLFPFLFKHGLGFQVNPLFFLFSSLLNLLIEFINVLLLLILRIASLRSDLIFSAGKIHNVWGIIVICNYTLKLLVKR